MFPNLLAWLRRLLARWKQASNRQPPRQPSRPDIFQLEDRVPVSEQIGPYLALSAMSLAGDALTAPVSSPLDTGPATSASSASDPSPIEPTASLPATAPVEPPAAALTPTAASPSEPFSQQPNFVQPLGDDLAFLFSLESHAPANPFAIANEAGQTAAAPHGSSADSGGGGGGGGGGSAPAGADSGGGTGAVPPYSQELPTSQSGLEALAGSSTPVSTPVYTAPPLFNATPTASAGTPAAALSDSAGAPAPPPSAPNPPPGPVTSGLPPLRVPPPVTPQLQRDYGRVPLVFEPNQSQVSDPVAFVARGQGYSLALTSTTEAVLALARPAALPDGGRTDPLTPPRPPEPPVRDLLRLRFLGASSAATASGQEELASHSNYFVGADPSRWRTDIPNYGRVTYSAIAPGVDLAFYGTRQGQLEYDISLQPGAEVSTLHLQFDGVQEIRDDGAGNLLLRTAGGTITQRRPVLYQPASTGTDRTPVTGRYVLEGGNRIGFQVDARDPTRPLVIDPILDYSSYLGGSSADYANGLAVDVTGNLFVTGETMSANFPIVGGVSGSLQGTTDIFVTKVDPTGARILYSTYLGGSSLDSGAGILVDEAGIAYLVGSTFSSDFPTTPGAFQGTFGGFTDIVVARLNAAGDALLGASYLGGSSLEEGKGIARDDEDNIYLIGSSWSSNFPTTTGAFQTTLGGLSDVVAAKVDADLTQRTYATYVGGSSTDWGTGIAVDASGIAHLTGSTSSSNYPVTTGAAQTSFGGVLDAFVTQLNAAGSALAASSFLGGGNIEEGMGITLGVDGIPYLTGTTRSTNFPTTTGAFQTQGGAGAYQDAFVVKPAANLSGWTYASYLGGSGRDYGAAITVDLEGRVWVTGEAGSSDYPVTADAIQSSLAGGTDVFVTQFNAAGSALVFSTLLGGSGNDRGNAVSLDIEDNIYLTGNTQSTNFPTVHPFQSSGSGGDAFVARLGRAPAPPVITGIEEDTGASDTDGITQTQSVQIHGTAVPNSMVTLCLADGTEVVTVPVDSNGDWVTSFPMIMVPVGGIVTLTIQMDATTTGPFSGTVSVGNNDSNENPYDWTISGTVTSPPIINDGDTGFSTLGNWTPATGTGFQDDLHTATTASNTTATWSFTVAPGTYRVAATWVPGADRASNAPFTVSDGSTTLAAATLNQRQAPNSFPDAGVMWQDLTPGLVTVNGTTLTVTLSASGTNGLVVADAIRVDRLPGPAVDLNWDSGSLSAPSTATVNTDFTVSRSYTISGQPPADAFAIGYYFSADDVLDSGDTLIGSETISAAADLAVGTHSGTSTALRIPFTGNGYLLANLDDGTAIPEADEDNNQVVAAQATAVGGTFTAEITDSGGTNYTEQGSEFVGHQGGYGGSVRLRGVPLRATTSHTATWTVPGLPSGDYLVQATWQVIAGVGSVLYKLYDGTNLRSSVTAQQDQPPAQDYVAGGQNFQTLATVTVNSGTLNVELPLGTQGAGVADAIRVVGASGSGSPEVALYQHTTAIASGTGSFDFGATTKGDSRTRTFTFVNTGTATLNLYEPISLPPGFSLVQGFGRTPFAEGKQGLVAKVTVNGQGSGPSSLFVVTVDRTAPTVTLTAPATTYDRSPEVHVTAQDLNGLPDGTRVYLDADLNNDGDFDDTDELNYTTTDRNNDYLVLRGGAATFEVLPDLTVGNTVRLRARVTDLAGNEGQSNIQPVTVASVPTNLVWSGTARVLELEPFVSDAQAQLGNAHTSQTLSIGVSPGPCGCNVSQLVVDSATAQPLPVVQAQVQAPNGVALPATLDVLLTWDGTAQTTNPISFATSGHSAGELLTVAAQVSSPVTTTGRHFWQLDITPAGGSTLTLTGATFVVSRDDSPFGHGVAYSDTSQLVSIDAEQSEPAGLLRVFGKLGWRFYEAVTGGFTSPPGDFGTFEQNTDDTYTYTRRDGEEAHFRADGRQSSWNSADGHEVISYGYDTQDRLNSITTTDGTSNTLAYPSATTFTITAPGTPNNRVWTGTLDSSGDLVNIEDPAGGDHVLSYSGHKLTSESLGPFHRAWQYLYGMVSQITIGQGDDIAEVDLEPAAAVGLADLVAGPARARRTDGLGHTTRQRLDDRGRPLERRQPDGGLWQWTRNSDGVPTSVTDPLGRRTGYDVDSAGFVTKETLPDGSTRSTVYDNPLHLPTSVTDANGHTTTYAYDTNEPSHLLTITDPLNQVTTYSWDNSTGLLRSVTDPRGVTTSYAYDSYRRLVTSIEALGTSQERTTTVLYDGSGNVLSVTAGQPTGSSTLAAHVVTTSFAYDGERRRTLVVEAYGTAAARVSTTAYDAAGNVTQMTDALGRVTSYGYDTAGRLIRTDEAAGTTLQQTMRMGYDAAGNVLSTTDALGRVTSFGYDPVNRRTLTLDAWGRAEERRSSMAYDLAGNVSSRTDPLGRRSDFAYDLRDRQLATTEAAGTPVARTTTTGYDPASNVVSVTDPRRVVTGFAYDALDRRTRSIEAQGTALERGTTIAYDPVGNVLQTTDALGRVASHSYDALNRRTVTTEAVGTAQQRTATMVYDAGDNLLRMIDVLGRTASYSYNALNQLTQSDEAFGTSAQRSATYLYDAVGNLLSVTTGLATDSSYAHVVTTRFGYDALNRQTELREAYGVSGQERRTLRRYDAAGNLVRVSDGLKRRTVYGYDALDRMSVVVEAALTPAQRATRIGYDAADRVAMQVDALKRVTQFGYDALNRTTRVTAAANTPARQTTRTAYDLNDNVLRVTDSLIRQTRYTYDALNRVTQTDEGVLKKLGQRTATFAYDAADNLLSLTTGQAQLNAHVVTTRYDYDALDRVTTMIEASGLTGVQRTSTMLYDAAGNLLSETHPQTYDSATTPIRTTTSYGYDALDRATTVIEAYGVTDLQRTSTVVYDAADNVRRAIDPLGRTASYSYDKLNRVTQSDEAFGSAAQRTATYVYNAVDNLVSMTTGQSGDTSYRHEVRTTFAYDALNRQTGVTEAAGSTVARTLTTAYDRVGNVASTTDALGRHTRYLYDGRDRPVDVTEAVDTALERVAMVVYDGVGNLRSVTTGLAASNAQVVTTSYSYDALNRPTGMTEAAGDSAVQRTSTMVYDAADQLLSETHPQTYDGAPTPIVTTTRHVYDKLGRQTQVIEADGVSGLQRTTTLAYDAADNLLEVNAPEGRTTSYAYDRLNRLTQTDEAANTSAQRTATYLYDAADNLRSVTSGQSGTSSYAHVVTTSFAYDDLNRQTRLLEAQGTGLARTTTTSYDAADNVRRVEAPLGRTTSYGYDKLNHLKQVDEAAGTAEQRTATMVYDAADNLLSVTTGQSANSDYAHVLTTSYVYDALNRQTQVVEAAGTAQQRTATVLYDSADNVLSVTSGQSADADYAHVLTTSFAYDKHNRQTRRIEAFGVSGLQRTITMVYDAADNVLRVEAPLGRTTSFAYDKLNRQTQVDEAANSDEQRTATMVYDAADRLRSVTTGQSNNDDYKHLLTTSFGYDALDRQTVVREAQGTGLARTTTMVYDAADNVLRVEAPLNRTTSTAYDTLSRPTQVDEAADTSVQRTATMSYDAADRLLSLTTGLSADEDYRHVVRTSFSYDHLDRRTATTEAVGDDLHRTSTSIYDAADNTLATVDPRNNRWTVTYDALSRPIAQTDPLEHTTNAVYDAANNVLRTVDAEGHPTTFSYDALSRQVTTQDPGGGTFTMVYDAADRVVNTIDQVSQTTTFVYDKLDRAVEQTDARGGVLTLGYDAADNVLRLVDPVANETTFAYDALNRQTGETDPLDKTLTYVYDAADRLTLQNDRRGWQREYQYDELDRVEVETWVADSVTIDTLTFMYDAASNLRTAAKGARTYTFTYDKLNRVETEAQPFGLALTFAYDANDNRVRVEDSLGGVTSSVYDAANRLTQREFNDGTTRLRIDLTWTARDQLESLARFRYEASAWEQVGASAYHYDNAGRLDNLQHQDGQSNWFSNTTYVYDAAHRLTDEQVNSSLVTFGYDPTNQLTSADGARTEGYSFDLNGNRNSSGYQTGPANRLTSDGVYTYTYDDEGNLQTKSNASESWSYSYDHRNQLIGVEKRDGSSTLVMQATYAYDAFRNRVEKVVDENGPASGGVTTTRFGYDGIESWADLDGSNALAMRRLYLDSVDSLFARISDDDTAAWYLTDRLGSVRNLADEGGSLLATYTYDSFGKVLTTNETSSSVGDDYKYTGKRTDKESGLQLNWARYYDPAIGRWMSEDPIRFRAGEPHLSRYLGNNPTNATDPFGLQTNGGPSGTAQPSGAPTTPEVHPATQRPPTLFEAILNHRPKPNDYLANARGPAWVEEHYKYLIDRGIIGKVWNGGSYQWRILDDEFYRRQAAEGSEKDWEHEMRKLDPARVFGPPSREDMEERNRQYAGNQRIKEAADKRAEQERKAREIALEYEYRIAQIDRRLKDINELLDELPYSENWMRNPTFSNKKYWELTPYGYVPSAEAVKLSGDLIHEKIQLLALKERDKSRADESVERRLNVINSDIILVYSGCYRDNPATGTPGGFLGPFVTGIGPGTTVAPDGRRIPLPVVPAPGSGRISLPVVPAPGSRRIPLPVVPAPGSGRIPLRLVPAPGKVPPGWQAEFDTLPDVSRGGRTLKQRYLDHLQAEGESAKSPTEFARTTLRNWANADSGNLFEMEARKAMGAPVGRGSKPTKTGDARPDLPLGAEFDVPLREGGKVRLRGVTDHKNVLEIYNSKDKYGKRQLTEMFEEAQARGEPFNLVISTRTTYITSEVADFVRRSKGIVLQFDPATKTFTRVEIGSELGLAWKRPGS